MEVKRPLHLSDLQQQSSQRRKSFPLTGLPAREYFTMEEQDREDDQATRKRQRVSVQHSTEKVRLRGKRRDLPQAVTAMREALISNMGEVAYNQLAEDQLLPSPPKTVKTEWIEILGCQNVTLFALFFSLRCDGQDDTNGRDSPSCGCVVRHTRAPTDSGTEVWPCPIFVFVPSGFQSAKAKS
ncbi:Hypp5653 [Branchiostoma lanceolatum]|uniref:Hypp5653 protein n=1 Tax=Branchiostoma lanceolatum TaxID=7740 RepID=A0A8J9W3D6_BRALA|nr:Hypp5653 [Branchiostoma lanceolatum]